MGHATFAHHAAIVRAAGIEDDPQSSRTHPGSFAIVAEANMAVAFGTRDVDARGLGRNARRRALTALPGRRTKDGRIDVPVALPSKACLSNHELLQIVADRDAFVRRSMRALRLALDRPEAAS